MSSRYSRQCWEHFRGRNEVHSRWFRNTMDHSTPAPSMSGCVPRLLCTGVFPFQSGADNHINHQAMMRFQRADSHEPHWYSTFCMKVWHKRELLLSLLFCAPWFPHQNKEIIILVPAHFLWTLTDWKAIKCVKAIWKLSAAQQGGTTTVANCHILSKKKTDLKSMDHKAGRLYLNCWLQVCAREWLLWMQYVKVTAFAFDWSKIA